MGKYIYLHTRTHCFPHFLFKMSRHQAKPWIASICVEPDSTVSNPRSHSADQDR